MLHASKTYVKFPDDDVMYEHQIFSHTSLVCLMKAVGTYYVSNIFSKEKGTVHTRLETVC